MGHLMTPEQSLKRIEELDYYEAQVEKHQTNMSNKTYRRCRAALGMARAHMTKEGVK